MQGPKLFRIASVFLFLAPAGCGIPPGSLAEDEQLDRVKASNVVTLRGLVGEEATVVGRIATTGTSAASGHNFLNFEGSELTAVCFGSDVAKFGSGKPADLFRGKDVEITGIVSVYRNKLQIRLSDPSQIEIVDGPRPPPETPSAPVAVELKKIGVDAWISPKGLKYEGRDPQGMTRVDHVLRHARDIPDRDGPHGVFDAGPNGAFAIIDEAWSLAREKGIRPKVERDRERYVISMGRRIGYLGGQVGARRNHPPLDKVLIVVQKNSTSVVTAYPY